MTESDRPRPRPASNPTDVPADAAAVPGAAVPDGGIAVALPAARPAGAAHRSRKRRGAVRRFFATPRGKWTAVAIAAVLALVVGLLSQGYFSSPAPPLAAATDGPGDGADPSSATTGPTSSASASPASNGPATAQDVKRELQARAGELTNPLNRLRSPGVHTVSITASSSQPLAAPIGYLIPTSIDTRNAYGTVKTKARSYRLSTRAVGPGYLALIFVQAGPTGAPVTCTVTIDGKSTSTESTAGPYGRQVCLG